MDIEVLAHHKVKTKENEKGDKYLNLDKELKKLWCMRITVIPTVISALGTVPKGVVRGEEE